MNLLLTNDDGIHAPGLEALEEVCRNRGKLLVVAPDAAHSGCSHRTTTDRPLTALRVEENRFAVDGSPADCVRLGLLSLAAETDLVLSGINDGGNLGVDIYMSGTVAAAREAALFGKPAIALSHYRTGRSIDWSRAAQLARRVLDELTRHTEQPPGYWNVNLPDVVEGIESPRIVFCQPDPHPLPVKFELRESLYHYCGDYHSRPRLPDSDVDVCFSGHIAVSYISLRAG